MFNNAKYGISKTCASFIQLITEFIIEKDYYVIELIYVVPFGFRYGLHDVDYSGLVSFNTSVGLN